METFTSVLSIVTFDPGFVSPIINEPCKNLPLNSVAWTNLKKKKKKNCNNYFHYLAVHPPSIIIDVPVIIEEASEAKKAIEVATSLIVTVLFNGVFSLTYRL